MLVFNISDFKVVFYVEASRTIPNPVICLFHSSLWHFFFFFTIFDRSQFSIDHKTRWQFFWVISVIFSFLFSFVRNDFSFNTILCLLHSIYTVFDLTCDLILIGMLFCISHCQYQTYLLVITYYLLLTDLPRKLVLL